MQLLQLLHPHALHPQLLHVLHDEFEEPFKPNNNKSKKLLFVFKFVSVAELKIDISKTSNI